MNQLNIKLTKKERNQLIYERSKEGYSQTELGKFYNLSQSQVSSIILGKKRGLPDRTKETRGSKSRLGEKDLEELAVILKNTATESESSNFRHWNKWSIKKLIKDHFNVEYHENYIWKLMKKIGFTSQIPQKKDYRKDVQKVEFFKKEQAPAIKKSTRRK